ncbi:MAG: hypothetical protein Q8865_09450 [Bacillota bacterium]|nr:hypothetical protein [Bacillota bacterium]
MNFEKIQNDTIRKEFLDEAIIHSNIWMYFTRSAIKVIKRCKELNRDVYRLEAFRIRSNGIQPSMTHSLIFNESTENWDEAVEFIKSKEETEFIFEIFYDGYYED